MPPARIVSARHVRGLQVGRDNTQLNHFEYRVENCHVDLGAALSRHTVHQQLRLLAADPDNPQLRRRADAELRRGRLFTRASTHRVTQQTTTTVHDGDDDAFETFLFVQDSSGVQVGNRSRQENFFFYVIAPTLDATELLRSDDQLRASIIEQVCSTSSLTGGTDLPQRLTTALERAVCAMPDLRTSGTVVDLRRQHRVDIRDQDGVSIGVRGRQTNDLTTQIALPQRLITDVTTVTDGHRQSIGRELARSIVDALRSATRSDEYSAMITALRKTFPTISIKSIRWLGPSELRRLENALSRADAADLRSVLAALTSLQAANRAAERRRPPSMPETVRQVDSAMLWRQRPHPAPPTAAETNEPQPATATAPVTYSRPPMPRRPGRADRPHTGVPDVTVETNEYAQSPDARAPGSESGVRYPGDNSCLRVERQPSDVTAVAPGLITEPVAAPVESGAPDRAEVNTVGPAAAAELTPGGQSPFAKAPNQTRGGPESTSHGQVDHECNMTVETAPVSDPAAERQSAADVDQSRIEQPGRTPPGIAAPSHPRARIEAPAAFEYPERQKVVDMPHATGEGSLRAWRPASPAVNKAPKPPHASDLRHDTQPPVVPVAPYRRAPIGRYTSAPDEIQEARQAVEHGPAQAEQSEWSYRSRRRELERHTAIDWTPEVEPNRSPDQARGIGGIG